MRRILQLALALVLFATSAAAQEPESRLQGTILDETGQPIPDCRVIARDAEGAEVYISPPSDLEGHYSVVVPAGREYVIVALVNPTGGRTDLTDREALLARTKIITRDIHIPMVMSPSPRQVGKHLGGVDRLFLGFVEDPALPHRRYVEVGVQSTDFNSGQRFDLGALAAFQLSSLPEVELGVRWSFANIDVSGQAGGSGLTDLEAWGKLRVFHSRDNKTDLAVGGILTLPTGDASAGLGRDAWQSKLFFTAAYALRTAVIVGNVGLRVTQGGELFGAPLDGRVSGSVGVGVIVPLDVSKLSIVYEASYDDNRFDDTEARGLALFGVNWRTSKNGKVRAAIAGGLTKASPDLAIRAGYAFTH